MRVSALLHILSLSSAAHYVVVEAAGLDNILIQDISSASPDVSSDLRLNSLGNTEFAFSGVDTDDRAVTSTASIISAVSNGLDTTKTSTIYATIIQTEAIDVSLIPTAIHDYNLKQRQSDPVDPPPSDPLPSLPEYGTELTQYLQGIADQLTQEEKWLDHKRADTFGKWYPFTTHKTAAGVKGLYGCTSVLIVSSEGVYASHIYENPVFVQKSKFRTERPSPEDYFRKASFDALINGDPDSGSSEPIKNLIGTTENPGALHFTFNPRIFLISPYKTGGIGPLMYANRIQWLADQLHRYLYPTGSPAQNQKPIALPYKIASKKIAEKPNAIPGKAIMEFTPLDRYEQEGDQIYAIARWRLWVNGKEAATFEYANEEIVCPVQCDATSLPVSVTSTAANSKVVPTQMARAVATWS